MDVKNYAGALLQTAKDPVALWAELRQLQAVLDGSAAIKQVLTDAGIRTPKQRTKIVADALKGFSELSRNLVELLVTERALHRLGKVVSAYGVALKREKGLAEVTVESAAPLSGPERAAVTRQLKQRGLNPLITEVVEPSLIGGLRLTVESQEYDYSVAGRLNRLEDELLTA